MWTSVDDYKTVCAGDTVYLTCSARDSWSLSWRSLDYVGQNAAIEFNRNFHRPGEGRLVSLANGLSTHAQMTTDKSNLQITIPDNLNKTQITCINNRIEGTAVTKTFILSPGMCITIYFDVCACCSTPIEIPHNIKTAPIR